MGVGDFIGRPLLAASGDVSDLVNPKDWLIGAMGGGRRVAAGVTVSPTSALNLSTYFACIRNVAEDIGKLEWDLEQWTGDEHAVVTTHPIAGLLDAPNPEMGSQAFREVMLTWALGWGNGFAEIERDFLGRPVALWPIPPDLVSPWRDPVTRALYYYVAPFHGFDGGLLAMQDVYHLHGIGPDGFVGWSIARLAAQDIGTGLAAQEFEGQIYAKGAVSRVALEYAKKLSLPQIKTMRKQWVEHYSTPENMAMPLILEGGMTAKALQISPRDAQFVETVKEGVYTIARWFRMPPTKLAALEKATLNNIEHLELEYAIDTLFSWATRTEGEANRKLLTPADRATGLRTRINLDSVLRADYKTRTDGKKTLVSGGILTPNEARRGERLNKYPNAAGDRLWMQTAMAPIDRLLEAPEPKPTPPAFGGGAKPPALPPGDGAPDGAPDDAKAAAAAAMHTLSDGGVRAARRQEKAIARLAKTHAGDVGAFTKAAAEFYGDERAILEELVTPAARGFLAIRSALGLSTIGDVELEALVKDFAAATSTSAIAREVARFAGAARGRAFDAAAEGAAIASGILANLERALSRAA